MALSIPVTWSDKHRLHTPATAVLVGVPIEADELPERALDRRNLARCDGSVVATAKEHAATPSSSRWVSMLPPAIPTRLSL